MLTGAVAALRARLTPRVVRWLNIASAALIGAFGVVAIAIGLGVARLRPAASGGRAPTTRASPPAGRCPAAAVFDWDGTLVDTMAMIYRANVVALGAVRHHDEPALVPRGLHARLAPRRTASSACRSTSGTTCPSAGRRR